MALSKIQAESMNLADTYAFTGTVSGAGGLVKLNTTNITSSTALITFDNTLITDTYNKYIIEYEGLKPVTDAVAFRSRYSTNNGSSFITGTFNYGYQYTALGASSSGGSGTTKSNYAVNDYPAGNNANHQYAGTYHINGMRDSGSYLTIRHEWIQENQTDNTYVSQEGWVIEDVSVINFIEFSFASGNIADGTFTLFGVAK